jgi:hypothetical protein
MVRPTDRPLLQVRVSFETTRLSPQHLIDAYTRLVPVIRRRSRERECDGVPRPPATIKQGGKHGSRSRQRRQARSSLGQWLLPSWT